MNKVITILTIGLQVTLTFAVTFCVYMVYALLDSNFGIDGLLGLVFIQPLFGAILSLLTIFACSLLGLPIRLNKNLNRWWTTHFYISISGAIIGLTFLTLALLPNFKETVTAVIDGQVTIKQIPNSFLACTGWLLAAFSFLHLYPPRQLTDKIKSIFQKNLIESPPIESNRNLISSFIFIKNCIE